MGKLNYAKWDNLELSDDSDIEVHPNVDKRSFIRWKQRDIHEKREMRKIERSRLEAESRTNADLMPELDRLVRDTRKEGVSFYEREMKRLLAGRAERGNQDGPDGPTLDDMLLSLLLQINAEDKVKAAVGTPAYADVLTAVLEDHKRRLSERQQAIHAELHAMDEEDRRKITSDSLHEGWSGGHVTKPDEPVVNPAKAKTQTQHIETLNPGASSSAAPAAPVPPRGAAPGNDSDQEEEEAPAVTPVMKAFASLPSALQRVPLSTTALPQGCNPAKEFPLDVFQETFAYLGQHKELLQESYGASDALLMQAFESQLAGQRALARLCTEKALLVQYCNKLGPDGVTLFFRRMMSPDGRAAYVFLNDVLTTYGRIAERAGVLAQQHRAENEGTEQIQLMAEDPNTVISFDVPDGPPPEHITIEGEGAETMDVHHVRAWLQRRWDIFQNFDPAFREALQTKQLERVNAVLGRMPVEQAEVVVQELDQAGILNFSSTAVRDETGRP